MKSINIVLFTPILALILLAAVSFSVPVAEAHNGEVHLPADATTEDKMLALVDILQELIALLTQQIELTAHDEHTEELRISVEEHGGVTHIHVYEHEVQTDAFFIEDLAVSEEEAIIGAIVEKTGLDVHAVEAAAVFPSGAHEEEVAETEEAHDEQEEELDLDGIHIMSDGSVMLGSGEPLSSASVTEDGMIKLEDGTLVEPAFDLR